MTAIQRLHEVAKKSFEQALKDTQPWGVKGRKIQVGTAYKNKKHPSHSKAVQYMKGYASSKPKQRGGKRVSFDRFSKTVSDRLVEASRSGVLPTLPELFDDLNKEGSRVSLSDYHRALREWMADGRLKLSVCNDRSCESRSKEGLQSDKGLLFYVTWVAPSAFDRYQSVRSGLKLLDQSDKAVFRLPQQREQVGCQ